MRVSGITLIDKLGQTNVAGEGHLHYFMNATPPTAQGVPAVTGPGTYAATAATSYTWRNVPLGTDTFAVEIVNNNHIPLTTPVVATSTIFISSSSGGANQSTSARPSTTPASSSPAASTSVRPSTSASVSPSASAVMINLTAMNMAFDKSTITVAAGAQVTIMFSNMDSGIPHNFSAYTNQSAATPIFIGTQIAGPATTTYTFTAPSTPGTYFFRCDVHPTTMVGQFIVQ